MVTLPIHHRHHRRDFEDPFIIHLYLFGWVLLSLGTAIVYMYSASLR